MAFTGSIPACATAVALPGPVARDAVTDPVEPAQAFDIKMNEATRRLVVVAHHRLGGPQILYPCPTCINLTRALQDAADRRARHAHPLCYVPPAWADGGGA